MTIIHLKSSASSIFPPLHLINPAIVGLFHIHLHVFVTSFKRQNNVTPSNAMTDVILQWKFTSASMRFPPAFKNVTLFDITCFFSIGYIGEVC